MNTANKLTMLRILMIPVFLVVLYLDFPYNRYVALAVFIVASATDFVDGHIARSRGLITDFGKFMDPLADKMLVMAAMLWFVEVGRMPAWALLIVVVREFAVSGLRLIAVDNGRVKGNLPLRLVTRWDVLAGQFSFAFGRELSFVIPARLLDESQTAELKNRMETVSRETPESRNTGGKAAV